MPATQIDVALKAPLGVLLAEMVVDSSNYRQLTVTVRRIAALHFAWHGLVQSGHGWRLSCNTITLSIDGVSGDQGIQL